MVVLVQFYSLIILYSNNSYFYPCAYKIIVHIYVALVSIGILKELLTKYFIYQLILVGVF